MKFHKNYLSKNSFRVNPFLLITSFLLFVCIAAHAQDTVPTLKFDGYTQFAMTKTEENKAAVFGFERVRIGLKGKLNEYTDYRLLVDFTESASEIGVDGETPGVINFAYLTFKPFSKMYITAGKLKTPIGMEWNVPAHALDFAKRGLSQSLVFHFDAGIMLHGSKIGKQNFGYALGVFNAGPNKANNVGDPKKGQDYTITGNINISPIDKVYLEASFGSALTSVKDQKNVNIYGAAARFQATDKLKIKGEYLSRSDEYNASIDGSALNILAGYLVHPHFEPIVRYDIYDVKNDNSDQNVITYGLNIFINPKKQNESKIQINYLSSDLKNKDAIIVLFQGAF